MRGVADAGVGGPALSTAGEDANATALRGRRRRLHGQLAVRLAPCARRGGRRHARPSRCPTTTAGRCTRRWSRARPSRPPYGGINIARRRLQRAPRPRLRGGRVRHERGEPVLLLRQQRQPRRQAAVYDDPEVIEEFPMAPVIRESLEQAAPRPQTAVLQRGLQQPAAGVPPGQLGGPGDDRREAADLITAVLREGGAAVTTDDAAPRRDGPAGRRPAGRGSATAPAPSAGWVGCWPDRRSSTMLAVTAYPILQAVYDSLFDYRLTDPDNRVVHRPLELRGDPHRPALVDGRSA